MSTKKNFRELHALICKQSLFISASTYFARDLPVAQCANLMTRDFEFCILIFFFAIGVF